MAVDEFTCARSSSCGRLRLLRQITRAQVDEGSGSVASRYNKPRVQLGSGGG